MRRPRLPLARRRAEDPAAGSPPTAPTATAAGAEKPPPSAQASATPPASATRKVTAAPQARADPHERIDGLRAWVAQVDRKLGVRTYVGAAIAVLALAAAAVGLVLTLSLKQDAATNDDVQSLRDQISAVQQSASQAAQKDVQALDQRLTDARGRGEQDVHRSGARPGVSSRWSRTTSRSCAARSPARLARRRRLSGVRRRLSGVRGRRLSGVGRGHSLAWRL